MDLSDSRNEFEQIFKLYYNPLFNLAISIVNEDPVAEEIVQEVFVKLWENWAKSDQGFKTLPYLLKSVRNRCYNFHRDQKVVNKYKQYQLQKNRRELIQYDLDQVDDDLILQLHKAIDEMPTKCKEVFKLSRFEDLTHKEIAQKLSISTKTVENHITRAVKLLKSKFRGKN